MNKTKVFLTGGDNFGWALDEDLKLTKQALQDKVEFTGLAQSDVIHSAWWSGILDIPINKMNGKRIICHIPSEPYRYFAIPRHRHVLSLVGHWVVRNVQAAHQLERINLPYTLIPYIVDRQTFYMLPNSIQDLGQIREKWKIPDDRYLIGNFHRDTEGRDLVSPKLVKGPDIFARIVHAVYQRGYPIHVVLAGPRRHWLRNRLTELGVPFTYIGNVVKTDDLKINILSRKQLNLLYNMLDLSLVTSRSEGGPQTIMEAAAAHCKIISTRVGLAEDILDESCIFDSVVEAVDIIANDIDKHHLDRVLDKQYQRIVENHSIETSYPLFQELYERVDTVPPYVVESVGATHPIWIPPKKSILARVFSLIKSKPKVDVTVGLWHEFHKPPWGGGNQFIMALQKEFQKKGVRTVQNRFSDVDAHLLQWVRFDADKLRAHAAKYRTPVVHRLGSLAQLHREDGLELDDLCFSLNDEFADVTIVQSAWILERMLKAGYKPRNPVIIPNAVDPDIFHPRNRIPFDRNRKIRLISTSWSPNVRKGGPVYKWIEENLDWNRFEYTFVGNSPEPFERINHIPPVASEQLADILRQHDIYITAARDEACSNALIEALSCGLPTLYINSGSHSEFVKYGGLPFDGNDDILPALDTLVENYEMFQDVISIPTLDEITEKYLEILRDIAGSI